MSSKILKSHPRIVIRHELRISNVVELKEDRFTIGRSHLCDIELCHDAVSRHHATLERRDKDWYVIDAGSVNGLRVNGRRVQDVRLTSGDIIEIKPFAINFIGGEPGTVDQSLHLADSCNAPSIARDSRQVGAAVKQRLEDLYGLSRLILNRKDNGLLWQEIHATLLRSLSAHRCVLLGIDRVAGFHRLAPQTRPSDNTQPLEISRSVLAEVIDTGKGLLIQRVAKDNRFAEVESLSGSAVGSVICVPVVVGDQVRAVVYADRTALRSPFKAEDLDFVIAAVDLAAAAVDIDELQVRAGELSRVRGRIDAAREMQEMMLPSPIPKPTWCHVSAANLPADQMSGDIYDVLIDPAGRLVVSIADVSGKGIPAAFVTGILQNTLRLSVAEIEQLDRIAQRVNASIDAQSPTGCFATMVICRWSRSGDRVEIANAGHHAPIWVDRSGNVQLFPKRVGLPLGVASAWTGNIVERDTSNDSLMLLYSDGATEACNQANEEYGASRLAQKLLHLKTKSADEIVVNVLDDVRRFCSTADLTDDVTLLVVKRNV